MSTAEKIQAHIEGHCKVSTRGKTWRCTSPLRSDSNSPSFAITFDGDEHGAWTDHVTKESGSLYDLAERLNIDLPERVQVASTKRAYGGLADYAQAHGVEVDVFEAAGWRDITKWHPGTEREEKAIAFPTTNGNRYRFLIDIAPRYINDKGYTSCWYGLSRAIKMATERGLPLVICNGEASTVVAQHYGVPACAQTNGEKKLPDLLLDELRKSWSGRVVLALDCDETGRQAALALHEQIDNSVIVDLGLSEHGDLADWCALHQDESLDDLLALTPDVPVRKSSKTMADERLANIYLAMANPGAIRGLRTNMPSVDRAFSGLVGGRTYCLYGDTGMGKSTLCASWAVKLGSQAPGLIFTTEIHGEAYLDKLACALAKVPFNKLEDGLLTPMELRRIEQAYGDLKSMHIEFEDGNVSPRSIVQVVLDAQRGWGCGWVMIDSLSKLAEGADYEQVTAAANAAQDIAKASKLPVITTSQVGRNLKNRTNKIPTLHDGQGSGMIEQNHDVVLAIYNHNYYVTRGEAEPDERFPVDTTAIVCLKDRWRGNTGSAWRIANVAGAAFYEYAESQKEQQTA